MSNRRNFLKAGLAGAFVGVTGRLSAQPSAEPRPATAPARLGPDGRYQLQYLNADDMRIVSAAVDRFIPGDDLSPPASELGVPEYIDRQLAGPYGAASRWYMQGPFYEGLPTQGYQTRRTPAELIRDGVRALDRYARQSAAQGPATGFASLTPADQDDMLSALEAGDIVLEGIDGQLFFGHLLELAKEGFLADPMYGGNQDMAGWKMIGFPGARANYYEWPEKTDQPYPFPPVSIKGT